MSLEYIDQLSEDNFELEQKNEKLRSLCNTLIYVINSLPCEFAYAEQKIRSVVESPRVIHAPDCLKCKALKEVESKIKWLKEKDETEIRPVDEIMAEMGRALGKNALVDVIWLHVSSEYESHGNGD